MKREVMKAVADVMIGYIAQLPTAVKQLGSEWHPQDTQNVIKEFIFSDRL